MPSDRAVALGVVATLVVFGAAIATLDVRADPAPGTRPGATAPAGVATRSPRQVLLTAAQSLDDAGSARVRIERQGPAGPADAVGTLSWGARVAADLETDDALGHGRVLMDDSACYAAHDAPAAGLAAGRWARADRSRVEALDPDAVAGGYAGGWMTTLVSNPAGRLHDVALTGRLDTVGAEQVDGVATTHYRATVKAAELFGADQNLTQADLAAVLGYYRERGVESLGYDIWTGADGGLLRMRQSAEGRAGTDLTTTVVSDPGVAFDVRVPAPDEVTVVAAASAG
ncbi:hypothetical protein [Kitasatospora sp. NBC_00315]|uniref:hypothetical protein n=1 Tax=Kitasatospora sp. NBC_00315 TaxID=2975963 RepID=UPI0032543007